MEERPLGIKILTVLYAIGTVRTLFVAAVSLPAMISRSSEMAEVGLSPLFLAYVMIAALGLLVAATVGLFMGERWGWIALASHILYTVLLNVTKLWNLSEMSMTGLEGIELKAVLRIGIYSLMLIYILTEGALNFFNLDGEERWPSFGKAAGIVFLVFSVTQLLFYAT